MVSLQQRQAADISYKNTASRPHGVHSAFQDTQEIVNTGKILHHRVENDRVEYFCLDALKVVRLPVDEGDVFQLLDGALHLPEISQCFRREVCAPIFSTV